ncbi:SDR family NAD(P)-dependent oxidoreductase, partial [Micromonospora sp. NPDC048898]|uniref:SDR family NAD(P)-dependent oxidoreductase n=1 Tax=Micromonospora sp. NPDC048898 TaxID=3364260 RepID=UPI003713E15C
RILLIDTDTPTPPEHPPTNHPQTATRNTTTYTPLLTRAPVTPHDPGQRRSLDGTVLITGGPDGLAGLIARHLATRHGARHLLLACRRGPSAPGTAELRDDLTAAGASLTVEACDVADREALAALLAGLPPGAPLTMVVHAAAVLADAPVTTLTAEGLRRAYEPKAVGARHLDELTRHLDLDAFVLFSSISGIIGSAGQGAYAAASTYLDGLAAHRRSLGLPAQSLSWGLWDDTAGMGAALDRTALARWARAGVRPLAPDRALALLDAALADGATHLVPAGIDLGAASEAPAVLRPPAVAARRRTAATTAPADAPGPLAAELAGLDRPAAGERLLTLVRDQIAAVLGHDSATAIDATHTFAELGLDSLTASELGNRVNAAAGVRLSPTLIFNHPTPQELAAHLGDKLLGRAEPVPAPAGPVATDDDPVVVVGMACRYPGGVASPEDLWNLVLREGDGIGEFPADRGWDEGLYDPDPEQAGRSTTRFGGFLYDAGDFDAGFFGVSPREALAMDPQQRQVLETSWEAFEHAGIAPSSLRGTDTGVFVGVMYHDYAPRNRDSAQQVEGYALTGNLSSVLSGRVAYVYGLEGPAVTVDTACSSSLVSLHLAANALRSGECTMALAGGVTVMATPSTFIEFSRQRGLAPDGRCKSFAASADGTGWSEGVGLLVLERMSQARHHGHRILAVLRGSAVNQDGASNGLTAPNGPSQERVIRRALADGGLTPADVQVVEGHGTGTRLGDPIEVQALEATYGAGRDPAAPLWLGSIKSNIGHAQAAAGVAGVIKVVMAMRHGVVP